MKTTTCATSGVRFVTAASLFDGHDAAINVIRRLLLEAGCETIHLGHNRSAHEIVTAAIQEDADGIAVSSYQGGHMEFFRYMRELLDSRGGRHVKIFGGGGGTIVPREIAVLESEGIERIYSPEDGRRMGLEGMIRDMVERCRKTPRAEGISEGEFGLPRMISRIEAAPQESGTPEVSAEAQAGLCVPIVGITGPGGAGKSSFTDELVLRLLRTYPELRVAVLAVDPTRRRTGGALLGDRIRMNSASHPRVFMRSLATRAQGTELSAAVSSVLRLMRRSGFDLILLETSGIGQGSSAVVDLVDVSVYVMTPEYGASSQLEKIDMLDLADLVVVNKSDRRGAADALRAVRKQFRRGRNLFDAADEALPVFGTVSAQFNDAGVTAAFTALLGIVDRKCGTKFAAVTAADLPAPPRSTMIPPGRTQYLAEISRAVRARRESVERQSAAACLQGSVERVSPFMDPVARTELAAKAASAAALSDEARQLLAGWPAIQKAYSAPELISRVRDRELRQPLRVETLAGTSIPRVALPAGDEPGALLRWLMSENVPGQFPFTAGVFDLKRKDEDPKRMFAGEGAPARTNARFHLLCKGENAKRLSTAFDSVTLYGRDPERRPDIYGKIGESGVSICTLDDMKRLFEGFDLCSALTSVSMTINGPAPIILACFMNAAIDQQRAQFKERERREPTQEEDSALAARTLSTVRGTVQADILKEDQAQNTCIFSTEFALRMMGDVQEFFISNQVKNYYSVSISGYHIAEAGANPVTQLAFTLANGFTYVEAWKARGLKVDEFAQNLSFFFSNGLDAEYAVIGRVARRIWAVALRDMYGAGERAQKLKYHIQTSGRSLHAQEMAFNDIRTTLQALLALQDSCNSLHTNAYDEAVTTPTEESVRRAMAIQYIITREYGISANENALQGSFIIEQLTDLVETAVLDEFERIAERGGVLGAMETEYQRGRIQEESLLYERRKHSGELPVVGVNTFVDEHADHARSADSIQLTRCTNAEKDQRIVDLQRFQSTHAAATPAALARLQAVALSGGNIFGELMQTVRVASLGQISEALFSVGGEYRRNM
ncbi:MAG: methylmalonyl-CoA mutase [Planctomycetes bacterium]|nr:methylmalonyl-CoA mutase [Planctomycetota bacterium]